MTIWKSERSGLFLNKTEGRKWRVESSKKEEDKISQINIIKKVKTERR